MSNQKINQTFRVGGDDPTIRTINVRRVNQGFEGLVSSSGRIKIEVFNDDGDGKFSRGDKRNQVNTFPGGERSLIFRTRRGATHLRVTSLEGEGEETVRIQGEIKPLFGVNTITLEQDPITNPGNTTPVSTPTQTVGITNTATTIHHTFDPINININVSGGIGVNYSGSVDFNHIFSGKIGVEGVLFSQPGSTPCGC